MLYLWDLGGHAVVDKAYLRSFSASHFATWNFAPTTNSSLAVEPVKLIPANYIPAELSSETYAVSGSGTLNYLAYFPISHLRILGVPEEHVQAIKDATSLEEVLALPGLSENVHLTLMDLCTSSELEAVLFDSSQLFYRTTLDRLVGYFEGKIKKLMLNLLPEQQQYVELKGAPLFLLKGVAGCGKTTIGIYRAIHLSSQGRRVLMLAFNNALSDVTRSLIEELIGPIPGNLEVRTLHSLMARLLRRHGVALHVPEDEKESRKVILRCLQEALYHVRLKNRANVLNRGETFFQEEIERVIKGFGLESLEEYIDPEWIQRQGTLPKLLRAIYSANIATGQLNQIALVRDYILHLVSRRAFRLSDFAVLCPTNKFCKRCQQELNQAGLPAVLRSDREFHILEERIKILTIHSAKGLEFPAVFLLGLTEDELPSTYHLQSLEDEEKQLEIEKQRILCYVGMTRAAEELYLVTVERRESRFVRELGGKVNLIADKKEPLLVERFELS